VAVLVFLLIRESLFTGVFGLAGFAPLLLPRPMMFYFGRHFMAGPNPKARQGYDASWALPEVRFANRLITIVWGAVYLAEFALRVVLVYTVPAQVVLVVSPILLGANSPEKVSKAVIGSRRSSPSVPHEVRQAPVVLQTHELDQFSIGH